jgi:hypothetical protein
VPDGGVAVAIDGRTVAIGQDPRPVAVVAVGRDRATGGAVSAPLR